MYGGARPITRLVADGVQVGAGTQLRLTGNTLAAGDVQIAGDPLCLAVVTTTAAGILLSTAHGFGIAGPVPDPADAVSAGEFVAAANPGSTTASATGPQFTACELPF